MNRAIAPVVALLASVAILLMGNGLQGTLLPVRANIESFSSLDIGVLGSAYFLGFAVGCLYGAQVVRRAGHIRTFTAMVAIASSVVLIHAVVLSPLLWWLLRAATGFCFAVLYLVIESWLNEKSTNENRGFIFSIYTIINLSVITLGQLMLMLAEPSSFVLFSLASIMVSLAAVPVALTKAPAPKPVAAVKVRVRRLYKLSPVGVIGCLAVGLANGSFWSLGPVFAQTDRADVASVSFFMSIVVIAGAVGQWPLGRLSDRTDRRKVIVVSCVGAAVAAVVMVVLGHLWHGAIFPLGFVYGMFAFPLYALCVAHLNDFVDPSDYVEAAGGLLLLYAVGAAVGPLIASSAAGIFGIGSLFAFTAVVHIATAGFALYRMRVRAPAPAEDRIDFDDAIRVAQTVSTVDPLSPEDTEAESPQR